MAWEIYPAQISIYPSDLIYLTARMSVYPPLWRDSSNSTVSSSYEVVQSTAAVFSGVIAQEAYDGACSAEVTLTADIIPDTGGKFEVILFSQPSSTFGVEAEIHPTQILVKDKGGTLKDTIAHVPVAGDKIKVEIAGITQRFYLNDTIETEFTDATASTFPVGLTFTGTPPFTTAGTPTIPAPVLVGQWEVRPEASLSGGSSTWTVLGGTVPDSTDLWQVAFTAGTAPGEYAQSLVVGGEAVQTQTGTITVLPLSILEKTYQTIEASSVHRFKTNYDNAQTPNLVAWSVVTGGGGSFDASGLYTAPSAAGTYTLRATSGLQQRDLIVIVENEITPDYTIVKTAEVVDWNSNMTGTLTWSASAGSINSTTGVWTAPSVDGQYVTITVTNGTATETRVVQVLEPFPYLPSLTQEISYSRKVIQSVSDDGIVTGRVKSLNDGFPLRADLEFRNRDVSEFEAVLTFWQRKYPHRPFCWTDEIRSKRHGVYFDSDLTVSALTDGAMDYSFRIREKA